MIRRLKTGPPEAPAAGVARTRRAELDLGKVKQPSEPYL